MPKGRIDPTLHPSGWSFVLSATRDGGRRDGPADTEGGHDDSSRVQLALNVSDLEAATAFYRDLFGVEPAKQRPGYANFEIADPPLKLVLFENPAAASPLNHLGVETATPPR